tara:strand:+ start:364 stop:1713 length:1350 start_codon:yes stop_codon:yes gene_type:complete
MAYIQRTIGTPTSTTTFTFSFWCKGGNGNIWGGDYANVFSYGLASDVNAQRGQIQFNDSAKDGKLVFGWNPTGSSWNKYITNRLFRDTAWYHIVVAVDTSQASAGDRIKMYVNGVQETSFGTENQPSQNDNLGFGTSGDFHRLGAYNDGGGEYTGYFSHFYFIDGTQCLPTVFGEEDAITGEWKIKTDVSVTYGNNGYFLFKDDASLTDQSGNGNNFSATSGTIQKSEDNPSNNFTTLNPLYKSNNAQSLRTGNTVHDHNGTTFWIALLSTLGMDKGKYYAEAKIEDNSNTTCGVAGDVTSMATRNTPNSGYIGKHSDEWGIWANGNITHNNTTTSSYTSAFSNGDIVMIAIDMGTGSDGKVYFGRNGTWGGSSNPSDGTSPAYSGITFPSTMFFASGLEGGEIAWNFGNGYFATTAVSSAGTNASGNGIFEYDVPTGYTALSTNGLNE